MQEVIVYRSPIEPLMYEYGIPALAVAIGCFAIIYFFGIFGLSKLIRMTDETKGYILIANFIISIIVGLVTVWNLM